MNTSPNTPPKESTLKAKILTEAKKVFFLTVYFGTWFCALALLATTSLHERPIHLTIFGLALIKAALCAKFMVLGQVAYPIKIDRQYGIVRSLLRESLVYLLIVLALSWLEAGAEGLFHHKNFFDSLSAFGGGDPLHILSIAIVYWLIVWPFLFFTGMKMALGESVTLKILFGPPKKNLKD
jgi:hypothetical protein